MRPYQNLTVMTTLTAPSLPWNGEDWQKLWATISSFYPHHGDLWWTLRVEVAEELGIPAKFCPHPRTSSRRGFARRHADVLSIAWVNLPALQERKSLYDDALKIGQAEADLELHEWHNGHPALEALRPDRVYQV